jgi:hypothetical protein
MASILVHDLDNRGVGKFIAPCDRGWFLYGHPGVDGEAKTSVDLPDMLVSAPWIQLGRMVYIPHPKLPEFAGVIDVPWDAKLPVGVTIYNADYLFSMRSPERSIKYSGTMPFIVGDMINQMNAQEPMFVSLGNISGDNSIFEEVLDRRTFWDQLVPILQRAGYEMTIRPERGNGKQLQIFVDIGRNLGVDTGFQLHDSKAGGNMKVLSAVVDGLTANRVVGLSGQSTAESVLETDVLEDEDLQGKYRTRSRTISFRNVTQLSTLTTYTQTYLDTAKLPYIDFNLETYDIGETFPNMRPGNRLLLKSAKVHLPGGVRGWGGTVRVLTMALDEEKNVVTTKVRGYYEI